MFIIKFYPCQEKKIISRIKIISRLKFFQAGFSRLTERDPEITTTVEVCQLKSEAIQLFFQKAEVLCSLVKKFQVQVGFTSGVSVDQPTMKAGMDYRAWVACGVIQLPSDTASVPTPDT